MGKRRLVERRSTRAQVLLALLVLGLPAGAVLVLEWSPPSVVRAARPDHIEPPAARRRTLFPSLAEGIPARRELGIPNSASLEALARLAPERTPQRPEASAAEIARLVRDLADDDVSGNAFAAVHRLWKLGRPANAALQQALRASDRQQRQLAAYLLYRSLNEPTPDLLAVAVEALEHDRWPYDPGPLAGGRADASTNNVSNAHAAARFLARHPKEARPLLSSRLASPDGQQRFMAAALLAVGKTDVAIERTCSVLIDHLQDNDLRDDARTALAALFLLEERALPRLRARLARSDAQGRALVSFLIECAEDPNDGRPEWSERYDRHGLWKFIDGGVNVVRFAESFAQDVPPFDDDAAGMARAPAH